MFDRQGIPEYLPHDNTNKLQFEDAIAPLISFSLIRAQVEQRSFEIHSLVQLSMRRSEEHTSELQSRLHLVCRLLLEKKKHTWTVTPHTTVSYLNTSTRMYR